MVDSEEYQKAKKALLYRLSRQALHSRVAKKWLQTKGFSPVIAEAVTTSLQEKGFIQDEEWVQSYVSVKKQKYGPRKIQQNLRLKGIDLPLSTLTTPPEKTIAALIRLLETRYRSKNLSNPKDRSSVFTSLIRRGFDGCVIQQAFSLLTSAQFAEGIPTDST